MGNGCASCRERYNEREMIYEQIKQQSKEKYAEYSLRAKVKYDEAKSRLKGYRE